MGALLSVQGLSKSYGSVTALKGLDLKVGKGQVFGLLGPNGSGKTTMLAILLDVIRANAGGYQWFEGDVEASRHPRRYIGALLETPNFYPYLNADQNLNIIACIKRVKASSWDDLLDLVQLKDRRRASFRTYSLGMKQRLALAACLVGDPQVLILDEPTNGLDPQGMIEVRHIIRKISGQGRTIILASHLLDEVEKICSHVAVLKNGKCLANGAVGSILSEQPVVEVGCRSGDRSRMKSLLEETSWVRQVQGGDGSSGDPFRLELEEGRTAAELNQWALEKGVLVEHLSTKGRSLEHEFLEITRS